MLSFLHTDLGVIISEDLFPNNEETYKFQKSYKFTNAYLFLNEEGNDRSAPTFFYTLNFLQDKNCEALIAILCYRVRSALPNVPFDKIFDTKYFLNYHNF